MNALITIVIPAYNAELYIKETINSVFKQTYSNWELIIVNDGSTDNTKQILEQLSDKRITVIHQVNGGVSNARNNGFGVSKGEFVVFLDSDDILSENFLEKRLEVLESNPDYGFCCGDVYHFHTSTREIIRKKKGISENVEENVLLYRKNFDTVPSNYLFRKSILMQNNISFEETLSSTADRLFLLKINKIAKGIYVEGAPLYYRISENSMSNKLTKKLVFDNIHYYKLLKKNNLIPLHLEKEVDLIHAYILGTACLKIRNVCFVKWYFKGFFTSPLSFFKYLFKKLIE